MQHPHGVTPIRAGQSIGPKKKHEYSGTVKERVESLGFHPYWTTGYVTFVDPQGISFYLMTPGRRDIDAFCKHGEWQHYLEPGEGENTGYIRTRHATRRFPQDFVG